VLKKLFFASILKVNDENSRIRIQDPDPDPDQNPDPNPDPLVRGMDPRIRIHPKMSWIRNTVYGMHQTDLAENFMAEGHHPADAASTDGTIAKLMCTGLAGAEVAALQHNAVQRRGQADLAPGVILYLRQ
jgi:hypothetical protein